MNPIAPQGSAPNPLLGATPTPAAPQANPLLARAPQQAPPGKPGSQLLAQSGQAIRSMNLTPEQAAQQAAGSGLLVHLLAPMARGKEPITPKNLAKAAAEMVAEGHMSSSDAVRFLTNAPTDPKQLKQMVQELFHGSIAAAINLSPPAGMTAPGAITSPPVPGSVPADEMPPGAPPAPGG